jgi:adenine-specific DNA-methyltransferase
MSTNVSKQKRKEIVDKIKAIYKHIASAKQDENTSSLLTWLSDIEKEINAKKFGLVFEEHRETIDEILETHTPVLTENKKLFIDNEGPTNFLIEGDNLAALQLLLKTHKGKIDVIYIDPPYNTGAKDWKYDNDYVDKTDTFRHSKWLSMMKNRVVVAKKLLKKDGVFICAIDENEQAALGLLLEEIFGINYEYVCITIVHNPRGIQGKNFSYTNEFAYFVIPKGQKIINERKIQDDEIDWSPLRNWGGESLRTDAKNCFYPVIIENDEIVGFGNVVYDLEFHPKSATVKKGNKYYVYPIDKQGIERKWRYARQSIDEIANLLKLRKTKEGYDILLGKDTATYKTVWTDTRYDANQYGSQIIKSYLPKVSFDFPKSIWNVYDCLYAIVGDRKNAIILDFFAGSGTTGHAVLELNKNDGDRSFILCTNNENNICLDVTYERIKRVIKKEKYRASLKYYKIDYISVSDKFYYEYADELLEHICELVELENGIKLFGNDKIAIVLSEEELDDFVKNIKKHKTCRKLYRGHDVLVSAEQTQKLKTARIKVNVIPGYYYGEMEI